MTTNKIRLTGRLLPLGVAAVIGAGVGLMIPQSGIRGALMEVLGTSGAETETEEAVATDDGHIEISQDARENLGLRTGRLKTADFERSIRLPAVIEEKPSVSNLAVSSRVHGIVTKVYAISGQAIRAGDPLFDIELTGEQLAVAQSNLLDAVQQIEFHDAELLRLARAAEGIAGKKRIQTEFERRRVEMQANSRRQELLVHGLTEDQVAGIVDTGKLIRQITVRMPQDQTSAAGKSDPDEWKYTVETLHVSVGAAVQQDNILCDVAYHTQLYVVGQGFEKDLDTITAVCQESGTVNAHIGDSTHTLRLLHLDNHVDTESQTFRFFAPLQNEIRADTFDDDGRRFRSWKYKPGQRCHISIPFGKLSGHFVLPAEAVVRVGATAFAFRFEGSHSHAGHADFEFEAVPVHLLHHDEETAVVGSDGELKPGERVAMNNAYQLWLAGQDSSGGHAHDHEH